jgi:hypothetical protein
MAAETFWPKLELGRCSAECAQKTNWKTQVTTARLTGSGRDYYLDVCPDPVKMR